MVLSINRQWELILNSLESPQWSHVGTKMDVSLDVSLDRCGYIQKYIQRYNVGCFDGSIVRLLDAGGWLELSAGGWLMPSQLWCPLCMLVRKGCWLASMIGLRSHTLDALRGRRTNSLSRSLRYLYVFLSRLSVCLPIIVCLLWHGFDHGFSKLNQATHHILDTE